MSRRRGSWLIAARIVVHVRLSISLTKLARAVATRGPTSLPNPIWASAFPCAKRAPSRAASIGASASSPTPSSRTERTVASVRFTRALDASSIAGRERWNTVGGRMDARTPASAAISSNSAMVVRTNTGSIGPAMRGPPTNHERTSRPTNTPFPILLGIAGRNAHVAASIRDFSFRGVWWFEAVVFGPRIWCRLVLMLVRAPFRRMLRGPAPEAPAGGGPGGGQVMRAWG